MEKGKVAGKAPKMVELTSGTTYYWCACGKSSSQPFCDGSHKGGNISPVSFKADETKKAALCMCKQTNNPPYCDGTHSKLED